MMFTRGTAYAPILVTKKSKKQDEVVVVPEVRPCKKIRCDDGIRRDFVGIAKALATLVRRADGDYDSSYDRHQDSSSGPGESSSAAVEVSGAEVPEVSGAEVPEEFIAVRVLTEVDEREADVVAEENHLPAAFPDLSLLSVSELTEAIEQPSEANVDVTGDILEPGEL